VLYMKTDKIFGHMLLSYSLNEKCFRTKVIEKIETNFVLKIFFFLKSYCL